MTSSSLLRWIFWIIMVLGPLVAGVRYASFLTDDTEPPRVGAESKEVPVGELLASDSYRRGGEDAHDHSGDDLNALRREVSFLRADMAAVQRRLNELARRAIEVEQQEVAHGSAVSGAMLTIDPRADQAAATVERQRLGAEREQLILAQAEANEAALQKETEDTAWSGEARDVINSAVAAEAFAATSVEDVGCRATLCRVEVTHRDRQARAVFEQQFLLAVAQLLPQVMMQAVESESGTTSTILYLARDGHNFPQPEL